MKSGLNFWKNLGLENLFGQQAQTDPTPPSGTLQQISNDFSAFMDRIPSINDSKKHLSISAQDTSRETPSLLITIEGQPRKEVIQIFTHRDGQVDINYLEEKTVESLTYVATCNGMTANQALEKLEYELNAMQRKGYADYFDDDRRRAYLESLENSNIPQLSDAVIEDDLRAA